MDLLTHHLVGDGCMIGKTTGSFMSNIILCVDDSVTIQKIAEITFRGSKYQYIGARSVKEGLALAKQNKPGLILADAIMPELTGYDFARQTKQDPSLAGIPVVILCGNAQPYDPSKGSQAGAVGYITKPWDSQVLLDKAGELIKESAPLAASSSDSAPIASIHPAGTIRGLHAVDISQVDHAGAGVGETTGLGNTSKVSGASGADDAGGPQRHKSTIMGIPKISLPDFGSADLGGAETVDPLDTSREQTAEVIKTAVKGEDSGTSRVVSRAVNTRAHSQSGSLPRAPIFKKAVRRSVSSPSIKSISSSAGTELPVPRATRDTAATFGVPEVSKATQDSSKNILRDSDRPATTPARPRTRSSSASGSFVAKSFERSQTDKKISVQTEVTKSGDTAAFGVQRANSFASGQMVPATKSPPTGSRGLSTQGRAPTPSPRVPVATPLAPTAPTSTLSSSAKVAAQIPPIARQVAKNAGLDPQGTEMQMITQISREVIERVVWEVVPDLAEAIILENLERLTTKK